MKRRLVFLTRFFGLLLVIASTMSLTSCGLLRGLARAPGALVRGATSLTSNDTPLEAPPSLHEYRREIPPYTAPIAVPVEAIAQAQPMSGN